ncbi:WbuC family cupin fold metalloprotein [Microcoleus sp. FACHB-1515]|uniref:WbuC family cupin fold metalloprotein n=1 Tax=Cyanophyceae TaxID=3028117 RepID=UPI001F557598|nr:WbuC family cupin fold metalloprotein [Microcoleus sp. FACHB-1515]
MPKLLVEPLPLKRLTQDLMDSIADQARSNSRQRQNYNFHEHSERVQRFLNVLQPGTYVRPHRHQRVPDVNGFEFFLVIQGAIGLIVMNGEGEPIDTERLSAEGATRAVELAEGTYHTLVALQPNTVMLEIKEGPYEVQTDKDFLPMFPLEGTPEAAAIEQQWRNLF